MIRQLQNFFTEKIEIRKEESGVSRERALRMATCAVLLEAAMADNEITSGEWEHLHQALRSLYNLDTNAVEELVKITREEMGNTIDLWQFTHLINQHFDTDQKVLLLEHVWRVILSDGSLDKFEDYLSRQLHGLLNVDHHLWIEAKQRAREALKG